MVKTLYIKRVNSIYFGLAPQNVLLVTKMKKIQN